MYQWKFTWLRYTTCILLYANAMAANAEGYPNLRYSSSEMFTPIGRIHSNNGLLPGDGANVMGINQVLFHRGYMLAPIARNAANRGSGSRQNAMAVFDISNPRDPQRVFWRQDNETGEIREAHGHVLSSDDIWVINAINGIQVWDVANPRSPKLLSNWQSSDMSGTSTYGKTGWWVMGQHPYYYLGVPDRGLLIIDVSNPRNPRQVKLVRKNAFNLDSVGSVHVIGNLMVLGPAGNRSSKFATVDLSDPENPRLLDVATGAHDYSVGVYGNWITSQGSGKLQLWDWSDPGNLRKISERSTSGSALYSAFQDGFFHGPMFRTYEKFTLPELRSIGKTPRGPISKTYEFTNVLGNLIVGTGGGDGDGAKFVPHQREPDTNPPSVNFVSPKDHSTNQPVGSRVGVIVTDTLDFTTVNTNTFRLRRAGSSENIRGKFSYSRNYLNFTPDSPLVGGAEYELQLVAGGIKDLMGNGIREFISRFTTASVGNQLPVVSINTPDNDTNFTPGLDIRIEVSAEDIDGSIGKVEFFNGETLLGEDSDQPYSLTWTGVPEGNYRISAIAYDNVGASTRSSPVNISVGSRTVYQAESRDAQNSTQISSSQAGYTGSGYVDFGGSGSWIEWHRVSGSGSATLSFRYANGSSVNRSAELVVNGSTVTTLDFAPTGGWTVWQSLDVITTLQDGNHRVRVRADSNNGGPNLDKMDVRGSTNPLPSPSPLPSASPTPLPTVSPAPSPGPSTGLDTVIQAENYHRQQGIQNNGDHVGAIDNDDWVQYRVDFASGADSVDINLAVRDLYAGQQLEFRLDAPNGPLIGTHTVMTTGGWSNYREQRATIAFTTGVHDIYVVGRGDEGIANLNWIRFNGSISPPIPNTPPSAVISATPTSGSAPLTVSFDARGSQDPDGRIVRYAWTFGDGSNADGAVASHTYRDIGSYVARLRVSDDDNATAESSITIVVDSDTTPLEIIEARNPPAATQGDTVNWTINTRGGAGNLEFAFEIMSPGGRNLGQSAWSASPTYAFRLDEPGHYDVIARARDRRNTVATAFSQISRLVVMATPAQNSSPIILSSTGDRVWNVNPDNNSVTVTDANLLTKIGEIPVADDPRTLAEAIDGRIWVASHDEPAISIIDPAALSVSTQIALPYGSRPFGIVISGDHAYVSLHGADKILRFNTTDQSQTGNLSISDKPYGLAIDPQEQKLFVARQVSPQDGGEVTVIDLPAFTVSATVPLRISDRPDAIDAGRGVPNYLGHPAISPDGSRMLLPSKQDNIERGLVRDGLASDPENIVRAIVSAVDLTRLEEDYPARIDVDNAGMPQAVAFSASGTMAFVAMQGIDSVAVLEVFGGAEITRLSVGSAPQGLIYDSVRKRLYVHEFLSRSISALDVSDLVSLDTTTAPALASIKTTRSELLSPEIIRGKQLFYNAGDPRMSSNGYLSCASCHLDGGQDARVLDFTDRGEGVRNTTSLLGRRGTGHGRVHWSGNFDEIQDFELDIRNAFGGLGFMDDADFNASSAALGAAKAGLNEELDALASYVMSLDRVPNSPYRNSDGSMTAEASAGERLFRQMQCGSCHSGSDFTDSQKNLRHDVGTLTADSGQRLGGPLDGIDTPTLKGIWDTAPYFHDGSAASLRDVIEASGSMHGNMRSLSQGEKNQLLAYLQQLDESSSPSASVAGRIIEAENYDAQQGVIPQSNHVGHIDRGDWLRFDELDFATGIRSVDLNIAVKDRYAGQHLEFRLDAIDGRRIGRHTVTATGGWSRYQLQNSAIDGVSGVHTLYIVAVGNEGVGNLDWIRFNTDTQSSPLQPEMNPAPPRNR